MKDDLTVIAISITVMIVIVISIFGVAYYIDKSSCYDKAKNYEGEITNYSFIKDYCFCKMPKGNIVNLENYRDINELNK